MQIFQETWQARAKVKVAEIDSRIPKEWTLDQVDLENAKNQRDLTRPFIASLLSEREVDIIRNDSLQVVEKIKSQRHTAVEVVQAYCKTAAIAQQINNCLHEIMFDKALHTARELDKYLKETGSVEGPLHGLPISLKDQFYVEGYDTTMGYVG